VIGGIVGGVVGLFAGKKADKARRQLRRARLQLLADQASQQRRQLEFQTDISRSTLSLNRSFEDLQLGRNLQTEVASLKNQAVSFGSSSFITDAQSAARGRFAETQKQLLAQRSLQDKQVTHNLESGLEEIQLQQRGASLGISAGDVQAKLQAQQSIVSSLFSGATALAGLGGPRGTGTQSAGALHTQQILGASRTLIF
jgi:hypothetical protein